MDQVKAMFGEAALQADLARVERFWAGEGRYLISVYPSQHGYRQNFDLDQMQALAPRHLVEQAAAPGIRLPVLWADWGTISTARYWGGRVQFDSTGGNIFIHPVAQTVDEALALTPRPVDDPALDAGRAVAFYREMSRRLDTEALWLRTPDMQGPLNTAGLVCNQEAFFMAMVNEPAQVHAFLEQVTEFLIRYQRYLRQETGGRICGNIWPYTFFPAALGVSLTEDLMPLTSARLYKTFALPCLRRLQEAFGGLHIHCCGPYGHHVTTLAESGLTLRAMEFHHPATRIEQLAPLAEQGVVFVPYIILHKQDQFASTAAFYRHLIEHTPAQFRYWFACASDDEEMLAFVRDYQ